VSKPVVATELRLALQRTTGAVAPVPSAALVGAAADAEVLSARVVGMMRGLPGREGPSLWPETVALFKREEPKWLADIDRLAAAHQASELSTLAHTLAGSCASFGAMEMRGAALALERAARAGDWPGVQRRHGELLAASRRLHAALAAANVAPPP
jgi:HPt (histidine-containing phosphotransfer) domain-containing protein